MFIETERLYMREMTQDDYTNLCKILQNEEVMYAYKHAFSNEEVHSWLDVNIKRYADYGFGLWSVVLKQTDEMIGQCGLSIQKCDDEQVLEIGYLFQKEYWHKGYATEAAIACKLYAFEKLNKDEVFSAISTSNIPSQNVAKRNGMTVRKEFIKHYYNMDMPHLLFSVRRSK